MAAIIARICIVVSHNYTITRSIMWHFYSKVDLIEIKTFIQS